MKKTSFLFILVVFVLSSKAYSQTAEAEALVGLWAPSSGKARVQIYKKGDKYSGRIVWLKEPNDAAGKAKLDRNNPDEELRKKPLLGYVMLKDFVYKSKNLWEEGTIYDPENGSTYSCNIELIDSNTLEVRGFIGVAIFGRTDTWKRIQMKN